MKKLKYLILIILVLPLRAGGFALSGPGVRELSIGGSAYTSASSFTPLFSIPLFLIPLIQRP